MPVRVRLNNVSLLFYRNHHVRRPVRSSRHFAEPLDNEKNSVACVAIEDPTSKITE
jgi:hypothetical protein